MQVGEGLPKIEQNSFFVISEYSQKPDSRNVQRTTYGTYVDYEYDPEKDRITPIVKPFQT